MSEMEHEPSFGIPYSIGELKLAAERVGDVYHRELMLWAHGRLAWQRIETAPRDGRPIIAYQPGGTYGNGVTYPACVGMANWIKADSLNPGHWSGPYNPRDYPTHWMPFPDPPSHD